MNILERIIEHLCSNVFGIRLAPRTIQLPITSYCNSRCTTCNVWKMDKHQHMDCEKLKVALKDPYLKKVSSVGINGGEPSLNGDFVEIISAVASLPKIKDIYVISNGMNEGLLLDKMVRAEEICKKKDISLHLTISLDGVEEIDDIVRGVEGAFEKTMHTIKLILADSKKYCDYLDVGYTISKRNVECMVAVKSILEPMGAVPYFHIAVPNKRIHTFNNPEYSILKDKRSMFLAREFFYNEFVTCKKLKTSIKNFINYYYLTNSDRERIAMCNYLKRDITIDENMNLYLCATASESVGNICTESISDMKQNGKLDLEAKRIKENCSTCIHYAFAPTFKGMHLYIKERLAKVNLVLDLLCARLHI